MVDPFFLALAGALTPDAIKAVVGLAWSSRQERIATEAERTAAIDESYELAIRLLGCLLYETRANIDRMRFMAETYGTKQQGAPSNQVSVTLGVMDFSIADAVMPDLCRVVPSPTLLEGCRRLVTAARRVDFYQRHAGGAIASGEGTYFMLAIGFANDAINKGVIDNFNNLVATVQKFAGSVYLGDRAEQVANVVPPEIDPSKPVDHSAI